MRDRRGSLGTCLAQVQQARGGDSNKLSYSLKKRMPMEGLWPADAPSWMNKPVVDGNSQSEALSLEMRKDPSGAGLWLHGGGPVLPYVKESVRRNPASAATRSTAVGLLPAPTECFAQVACSGVEALERDWLGGGARATDGHRGQCPKGEPRVSRLLCHQKLPEMGSFQDDPPNALPKGLGSELEPSCLHSVLSATLHACPEVLLNDETKRVFLDRLKPMFSKQTMEFKKMLKNTSDGLQITLGLLALQPFELANSLCHS
ncbi:protein FAM220A [Macaca fascicularis]|uniref:Family with sequence similarity 220 member A n=2 Tax=Macaca fascicularis TaxID=9541 RepID=A0A2K5X423_MACFA|nr:STAT3-interacting protein as a repressor [Macaca fascicularis]